MVLPIIGYSGKNNVYADYNKENQNVPQLVAVLEGVGEHKYPWMINADLDRDGFNEASNPLPANPPHNDGNVISDSDDNTNYWLPENTGEISHPEDKDTDISKPQNTVPTEVPQFQFQEVTRDYFKDALFIGDSRTVGLSEYSGWKEPTFYADEGMSIYDIFQRKIANVNGREVTIIDALKAKSYGKIYIMLGINELGTGTTKTFVHQYRKVIEKIQTLQPNAIIFVEGIMNVTKEKSSKDPIFNNINIKKRNVGLSHLANNKEIYYINVNEVLVDKKGNIPSEYTFDCIHLKAAYYKIWTEFLLKHGVASPE